MTGARGPVNQPNAESVAAQHDRSSIALEGRLPKAAKHLEDALADLLAFMGFPKRIWRQIWSNNPQRCLNKEILRRTDVVGIFLDRNHLIRLVGPAMAEQHDGVVHHDYWLARRRWISHAIRMFSSV